MYFDTTEKYLLFVQELRYTIDRLERENNQKKEIINQVYVYKFFREINSKKCLKQFFPWNWCSWYNCDAMGSLTRPTPFGAIYLPISDFSVRRPILPYNITYLRTLYHLMIYQGVQVTPRTVHLIIMIWYKNIFSTYPWHWHWILLTSSNQYTANPLLKYKLDILGPLARLVHLRGSRSSLNQSTNRTSHTKVLFCKNPWKVFGL